MRDWPEFGYKPMSEPVENDNDSEILKEPQKHQKLWVQLIGYLIVGVVAGIFLAVPWKEIWKSISPFAESPKPIVVTADDMKKANLQEQSYQRFVPISAQQGMAGIPWHGFFALDTKTGQLCQTVPLSDNAPAWTRSLPQCIDLSKDH
jgi:hypothetical protein